MHAGRTSARLGKRRTGLSTSTGTRPAGGYGRMSDFYAYNGGDARADNEINDVGMEARLCADEAVETLFGGASVGFRSVCRANSGRPAEMIELPCNGSEVDCESAGIPFEESACGHETSRSKRRSSIGDSRPRLMGGFFLIRMISMTRSSTGPAER